MPNATKHIALICPGGPITADLAEKTRDLAAEFGDAVALHFHPQCFLSAGHFAGSDAERTAAFLDVANDDEYDAVWIARGGYGAVRLSTGWWTALNDAARRKTYLGYSDAGVLLARLYKEKIGRPVHGPMPVDFASENGAEAVRRALHFLVDPAGDELEPSLRDGAPAAAFNIAVLAHLAAGDALPDLTDHVLMLEEIAEYLYATDRALSAISAAPFFKTLAGVRLGRLNAVPENDRPFGHTGEEIVKYWCARAGVPYLGRADIGHDADNKIVPFGGARLA